MWPLAQHSPVDHVVPHSFYTLPFGVNFGAERVPLLNFPIPEKFALTNHLLMTVVAALLCLGIFTWMGRRYAAAGATPQAPRGALNLLEMLLQFVRENVARPILRERTDEYVPILWTLFFFILFCNLLGMIPLDSIVYLVSGRTLQHVGGTPTGNIAVTGGLAILAFLMFHVFGVREVYRGLVAGTYGSHHDSGHHSQAHGGLSSGAHAHGGAQAASRAGMSPAAAAILAPLVYLWNFAPHIFKPGADAGPVVKAVLFAVDFPIWVFLLALEFIGALVRPFALMIRLFANMVAGHIVLASILMLIFAYKNYWVAGISVLGCVAISLLELFVAGLQAYIFVFLTTLFLSMSVAPEH